MFAFHIQTKQFIQNVEGYFFEIALKIEFGPDQFFIYNSLSLYNLHSYLRFTCTLTGLYYFIFLFFFGKVNPLNNSIYRTLVESTSSKKPDFISQRTVSILKFHFHKSIISSRNGYPKTYIIYYLGIFSKIRFEAKGKFKKKPRILFIFHHISLFYNIPKHFQFSSPADL